MGVDPPVCVGTYERGNTECDGSEADPQPCTWRNRCGALKTYLRRSKQGLAKWLELEGWEIRRWCDQWIEAYEIKDGLPKGERLTVLAVPLREAFDKLVEYLATNTQWQFARDRLALPGELYLVDRLKQNRYVALYVRARQGHDRPFVRAQLKPQSGAVELRLPLEAPKAARLLGVDAVAIRSGKFRSRLLLKAAELEAAGPLLCKAANAGELHLPAWRVS